MRLTLPEPANLETDGFAKNDIFGYSEFGERLANIVSNINEPLIVTLDGPWGSGKSVFIKQWAGLINQRGGSVTYFDAFKNDFHEDAFFALAAQIHSLAEEALGEDNHPSIQAFLNATKEAIRVLAPIALDVGLRTSTAGFVGREDIEAADETVRSETEKKISKKLKKVTEEHKSLEVFRESLRKMSETIAQKKKEANQLPPLVFIVDELDRCRPPFALEVIEHIKHLFSVENVCFVLVTNLTHLGAAIRGAYGVTIDDHIYLEKFYQLKVMLPESDFEDQNQRNTYLIYLWSKLQPKFERPETNIILEEIRHLANAHTLSLRQIEHVMRNIVLVAAFSSRLASPSLLVTIILCIMRQTHPKLYDMARRNNLSWKEVEKFLKIDKNSHRDNYVGNIWRYISAPDVSEEIAAQYSSQLQMRFLRLSLPEHRLLLQRIFTNEIDSLLGN